MYVEEVAEYFRIVTDEPDKTFLTDAQVAIILKRAYSQYSRIITSIDEKPFTGALGLTNPTLFTDLTVAPHNLLGQVGPYDGNGRMVRLQSITSVASNGQLLYNVRPAQSIVEMSTTNDFMYFLGNDGIIFSSNPAGRNLALFYTFAPDIDWTKLNSGDAEAIDNFEEFHDVIALLAYKIYAVKDISINPALENLLAERVSEMKGFWQQGMDFGGSQYVSTVVHRT
jgi:hypothetical protein